MDDETRVLGPLPPSMLDRQQVRLPSMNPAAPSRPGQIHTLPPEFQPYRPHDSRHYLDRQAGLNRARKAQAMQNGATIVSRREMYSWVCALAGLIILAIVGWVLFALAAVNPPGGC